jgi:formylglycine-generating enzyme required for sulfatase activity
MKKICFLAVILMLALQVNANNIIVSNATCTGQNTGASPKYTGVKFNLTWDNSWRMSAGPANWDAAWVFVKYKVQGGNWAHATLSTTATDHSIGNNSGTSMTFSPTSDGKGVFLYRSADGTGNINLADVILRWNYGTDGVADAANLQVQVFAVEMVYIPAGPFFIGDGNVSLAPSGSGYKINNTGNNLPYKVIAETAITVCSSTYGNSDQVYDPAYSSGYTMPSSFPKGYAAFYLMKYEVSQKQYVDFFNTLPKNLTILNSRNLGNTGSYRNSFSWSGQVNDDAVLYNSVSGDRAQSYLNGADAAAYADWAALRPMTELEYEKASRGCDNTGTSIPIFPVNLEYAWGNTTINYIPNALTNDGTVSEGISNPLSSNANCQYGNVYISGPVRCGIFAAKGWASNQRTQSGASYYGVMELSGNLNELLMVTYNYTGGYNTIFNGSNGDGVLNSSGNSDNAYWAQYYGSSNTEVTTTYLKHWGMRGGSWTDGVSYCRTSDRSQVTSNPTSRSYNMGFRACRKP